MRPKLQNFRLVNSCLNCKFHLQYPHPQLDLRKATYCAYNDPYPETVDGEIVTEWFYDHMTPDNGICDHYVLGLSPDQIHQLIEALRGLVKEAGGNFI
jgi:hypothetical protein